MAPSIELGPRTVTAPEAVTAALDAIHRDETMDPRTNRKGRTMRRTLPAAMALLLTLGAAPVLAQDAPESAAPESAAPVQLERAEAPELGIAMAFPAGWRVSQPEGLRLSALTTAEGEPVMETTALYASGGGSWCDVDAYFGLDASLEEHAYAYVSWLQRSEDAAARMVVVETEIPAGPAYRIEVFDPTTGRLRAMYLFDGAAAEDGTVNRFLFTCATREADDPFWEAIAETAEVFAPVPAPGEDLVPASEAAAEE